MPKILEMVDILDSEKVEKNFITYIKANPKAIDILKKANGKRSYQIIAKEVGLNEKTVSPLLKSAESLGLAKKENGFYKKITGIMKFKPIISSSKCVQNVDKNKVLEKFSRRKFSDLNLPKASSFCKAQLAPAKRMVIAYQWLYLTENTLRELIRNVYKNKANWWTTHVNTKIQGDVKDLIANEPYDAIKRKDELEYTHLGQLKEIIIAKNNWKDFISYLEISNKDKFQLTFDNAVPLRNCIAHSTPLNEEDMKIVDVRFRDIINMLK